MNSIPESRNNQSVTSGTVRTGTISEHAGPEADALWFNRLIRSDNLLRIQALLTKLSCYFIMLVLQIGAPAQLFAQGTAFLYQGRLTDGANPAQGIYDLRFTLCDAATNGNAIGSLTNVATSITNGLFTVALDFGGIFNGSNYWLELAARTNGGGAFTAFAPRQPILPTPYALYAANAGSAGTAATACSLACTNFNAQWTSIAATGAVACATTATTAATLAGVATASIVTNGATGLSLAGNLVGNATLASNVVSYAIGQTNLDNATWLAVQTSQQSEFLSYNRGYWKKSAAKIASGQPLSIELDGSGLLQVGILDGVWTNLLNHFNLAGFKTYCGLNLYPVNGTPAPIYAYGKDTNWYAPYFIFFTNTCALRSVITYPWNVVQVEYLQSPVGASFKLQTNNGIGGAFVDCGATFPAVGTNGALFLWTNNAVTSEGIQLVQTGPGTNIVPNMGAWNNTLSNSILVSERSASSSGWTTMNAVPTNWVGPIYAAQSPDIIFCQSIEGSALSVTTNFQRWIGFYTNWVPNAELVVCGTYPVINTGADVALQNRIMRTNVINWSISQGLDIAYFDGQSPFIDTNNSIARGFLTPVTGDPHYNPSGCGAYGFFLSDWLDFEGAQFLLPQNLSAGLTNNASGVILSGTFTGNGGRLTNISANAIVGGLTTNIVISGHTFYYTNGILMNIQ